MNTQSKALTMTGWGLAVPVALLLAFSASMKLQNSAEFSEQFTGHMGYPANTAVIIGIVELACLIIFLIPKTSVLGAILLTGYMGGAVATHVRVSEAFIPPVVIGVVVWASIYLRDARVRALIPLRSAQSEVNETDPES